jgi:hypothetical protein
MIAMRFNLTRQMPPAAGKVALLAIAERFLRAIPDLQNVVDMAR